jgi:RsiW-degrading membrane proteinase PrsW (M82 family)
MLKFFAYYFCAIILFVLLVNYGFKEPEFRNKPVLSNPKFEKSISETNKDSLSFGFHIADLNYHYTKPYYQESEGSLIYRKDEDAAHYYEEYTRSAIDSVHDIGCLSLMVINHYSKLIEQSNKYSSKIKNKDIPYYHYYNGYALLKQGYREEGVKELQKELSYKVYNDSTYIALAKFYYAIEDYDQLLVLFNNPEARKVIPESIKRSMYFLSGDVRSYIEATFFKLDVDWLSFIAGIFIMLVWFFYIVQLKVFLPKNWGVYILIFALGFFLSELCFVLYDFYELVLRFELSGNILNDLFFSVFGIGVIEEFVKFLPVLLFIFYKRKLDEPIDYIILCSLSAIGFAFSENMSYFNRYNDVSGIVHSRGMICVVVHFFCSSIVAYGIILAKYKNKGFKYILLYFLAASFCHGFYDFWLLNKSVYIFHLYSYVLMLVGVYFFRLYSNSALNISPYFKTENKISSDYLKRYLIIALTGVLLLEYFLNAVKDGPVTANDILVDALIGFIVIISVQASNLANFDLVYDYIIKPFHQRNNKHDQLIGTTIFFSYDGNTTNQKISIISREVFNDSPDFLIVKTETPIIINNTPADYFILQIRSTVVLKNKQVQYKSALYSLDSNLDLNSTDKKINIKTPVLSIILLSEVQAVEITRPSKAKDRLYVTLSIASIIMIIVIFYNYMQFKSATNAYYYAEEWIESKDLYNASQNLLYSIKRRPSYIRSYLLLAKIDLSLGQYSSALQTISKGLEEDPENPNALYLRGIISSRMMNGSTTLPDFESAAYIMSPIKDFEKVRRSGNAPDSLYYFEALLQMREKGYSSASDLLDSFSLKIKKPSLEVFYNKGLCKYYSENYSEAEKLFISAAKVDPKHYITYHYLGICELQRQDTAAACIHFSKAHLHNITLSEPYLGENCNFIIYPEVDSVSVK